MRSSTGWLLGTPIIVGGIAASLILRGSEPSHLPDTSECRADKVGVTDILDFGSGTHLFEHAGVTAFSDEWIVAGTEVDAAWETPDDIAASSRRPRIVQQGRGELDIPRRDSELPMELPVPVPVSDTRWGLVWAEAQPFAGFSGEWIPTAYTRLWLAEREANRWKPPTEILRSKLGISWETNRTIVSRKEQGTLLMVVASETLAKRHIMFGSTPGSLSRIELPAELTPWVATFLLEQNGSVLIIAQVKPSRTTPDRGPLIMMQLQDGSSIAAIDTIWSNSDVVRLRAHRDRKGTLHVVWTDRDDHLHHIARAPEQNDWTAYVTPLPSGIPVQWVSGIDRCGRVAVIAQVLSTSTDHDFEIARWERTAWSSFQEAFPGFYGLGLFDGVDEDDNWYVGWSGARKDAPEREPLRAWLAMP